METENNTQVEETTESKGLGDTIAKITAATGIDKLIEEVTQAMGKEDCGCNKRRRRLNDLFPYRGK